MIKELDILRNLEYVRTSGSEEELKAAEYIKEVLKEIGIESEIEEFKVNGEVIDKQELTITRPYLKTIECKAYYGSGNCEKLKKEFYYLRDDSDISLANVKDKIVYVDGYLRHWLYSDLYNNGAAGFICANGYLFDGNKDIDQRELRPGQREIGIIPGVQINVKDSYEMVQNEVSEVEMTISQHEVDKYSHNVIARIQGADDDVIVFSAHYDSTSLSKGINDNATGVVALIRMAEYFSSHKPKHSLIFVFTGSEERGLLGGKAYVQRHEEELGNIKLNINVDMIGETMGSLSAYVTGEMEMVSYLKYFAKEKAYPLKTRQGVASTDSTAFADKGIPAIAFNRSSNLQPIHLRYDDLSQISIPVLQKDIEFILNFAIRMANAAIIPIKRTIPDKLKEELDIYLLRKRKDQ